MSKIPSTLPPFTARGRGGSMMMVVSGQKWTAGKVARTMLLSDAETRSFVGDRIYPLFAPEGTELPLVVYRLASTERSGGHMKGNGGQTTRTYQIMVYGQDYDELDAFAFAFRERIQSWRGVEGELKVRRVDVVDESDEPYDRPEGGEDNPIFLRVFTLSIQEIESTTSLPSGSYGS